MSHKLSTKVNNVRSHHCHQLCDLRSCLRIPRNYRGANAWNPPLNLLHILSSPIRLPPKHIHMPLVKTIRTHPLQDTGQVLHMVLLDIQSRTIVVVVEEGRTPFTGLFQVNSTGRILVEMDINRTHRCGKANLGLLALEMSISRCRRVLTHRRLGTPRGDTVRQKMHHPRQEEVTTRLIQLSSINSGDTQGIPKDNGTYQTQGKWLFSNIFKYWDIGLWCGGSSGSLLFCLGV